MTDRAKGWLYAAAFSLAVWTLVAIVAHEAVMLWDEPVHEVVADNDA
jgi:hypothetical protein